MSYERDEAMRQQEANMEMIRMRQPDIAGAIEKFGATANRIADERNALKREVDALRKERAELDEVLDDIKEFLKDQHDVVDGPEGQPRPNRAMSLSIALERAWEKRNERP